MISSEKRKAMVKSVEDKLLDKYGAVHTENIAESIVDDILAGSDVDVEVEEPTVMPGISEGTWVAVKRTRDVRIGNLNIASVVGVTEAEGVANTVFVAGSKEVTEKVIAYLEWLLDDIKPSRRSDKVLEVLAALEKQGCNVDKFRRSS